MQLRASNSVDGKVGTVTVLAIRDQSGVGDRQFLRSMIPHHAGALLMCGEAPIADEVKALCGQIPRSQQSESDQVKAILNRL